MTEAERLTLVDYCYCTAFVWPLGEHMTMGIVGELGDHAASALHSEAVIALGGVALGWLGSTLTEGHFHRRRRLEDDFLTKKSAVANFIVALEAYRHSCYEAHARLLAVRGRRHAVAKQEIALSQRPELSALRAAQQLLILEWGEGAISQVAATVIERSMDFAVEIDEQVQVGEEESRTFRDGWAMDVDAAIVELRAFVSRPRSMSRS